MSAEEDLSRRESDLRTAIAGGSYELAGRHIAAYCATIKILLRQAGGNRAVAEHVLNHTIAFLEAAARMTVAARAHDTARLMALPSLDAFQSCNSGPVQSREFDA